MPGGQSFKHERQGNEPRSRSGWLISLPLGAGDGSDGYSGGYVDDLVDVSIAGSDYPEEHAEHFSGHLPATWTVAGEGLRCHPWA